MAATTEPSPGRLRTALLLCAAIVVAVALAGVAGVQYLRHQGEAADRAEVVSVGREAILNLTSFGYLTAEADVGRLAETATPRFLAEFEQDKDSFLTLLREGQVTTTSEASGAGLAEYADDTATVLVAVRSTLANVSAAEPENRTYRVSLAMVRQDGQWLADRVEFMP
jgi:Mce-associated membrane protein